MFRSNGPGELEFLSIRKICFGSSWKNSDRIEPFPPLVGGKLMVSVGWNDHDISARDQHLIPLNLRLARPGQDDNHFFMVTVVRWRCRARVRPATPDRYLLSSSTPSGQPKHVISAIDPKARLPKTEYPPVRIVRFSGAALSYGAALHTIEGVTVRITTPAKTVADCFKYRNKIGLDVALEALRDCYRERKASLDEIWQAAKVCRVANVIRPYMESLT
jgi:hypothetical protein